MNGSKIKKKSLNSGTNYKKNTIQENLCGEVKSVWWRKFRDLNWRKKSKRGHISDLMIQLQNLEKQKQYKSIHNKW